MCIRHWKTHKMVAIENTGTSSEIKEQQKKMKSLEDFFLSPLIFFISGISALFRYALKYKKEVILWQE